MPNLVRDRHSLVAHYASARLCLTDTFMALKDPAIPPRLLWTRLLARAQSGPARLRERKHRSVIDPNRFEILRIETKQRENRGRDLSRLDPSSSGSPAMRPRPRQQPASPRSSTARSGQFGSRLVSDRAESNGLGTAAVRIALLSPGRPRYRGPACDATTRQSPTGILGRLEIRMDASRPTGWRPPQGCGSAQICPGRSPQPRMRWSRRRTRSGAKPAYGHSGSVSIRPSTRSHSMLPPGGSPWSRMCHSSRRPCSCQAPDTKRR